jgi:CRP/FNR family transcriptional regulator, cyclic AMP receptor protein
MTDMVGSSLVDLALVAQLCEVLEQVHAACPTPRRAELVRILGLLLANASEGTELAEGDMSATLLEVVADLESMRRGDLGSDAAVLLRLQAPTDAIADVLARSAVGERRARKLAWVREVEALSVDSVDWDTARGRLDEVERDWKAAEHVAETDEDLWQRFCTARSELDRRHANYLKEEQQHRELVNVVRGVSASREDRLADQVRTILRNNGRARAFRRGEVLIAEGAPSDEVLLIESGKVKIVLHGPNGADSILGFYGAGALMGEMGVMGNRPRSADVIARTPGVALHIEADTFRRLLRDYPGVSTYVTEVLEQRLFQADQRQRVHASFEVSVRVARQLLSWAQTSGELVSGGGLRVRGLTQLEIAQFVTASAKTVDHVLKQLRSDKLLETGRRSYLLPDPQLLERCLSDPDWRPGRGDVTRFASAQPETPRTNSAHAG